MENTGGSIDEKTIIPELCLEDGKKLDLQFLIHYRQTTILLNYFNFVFKDQDPELEILKESKAEILKGNVDSSLQLIDVRIKTRNAQKLIHGKYLAGDKKAEVDELVEKIREITESSLEKLVDGEICDFFIKPTPISKLIKTSEDMGLSDT